MAEISSLFVTSLYRAPLGGADDLNGELAHACRVIAAEDEAGKAWSREKGYRGYTSYASLNDLPKRDPAFADLKKALDRHAGACARGFYLDLAGRKLVLDSIWINVLEPGGVHTGHIHPHAALSGTYYVDMPKGASALKFEDPRLAMMMAAPPRTEDAPERARSFVYIAPQVGEVLMWESWLRHEAPANGAKKPRISISFNYRW